jgi:hypothetical protein
MSREIQLDPRWFAKIWCYYKGDLFAFYYGTHKNYSLAQIISLYKKIKRAIPRFPTLVVKNEDFEKCPKESYFQIRNLIDGNNSYTPSFCEKFSASKQQGKLVRFRGKQKK